MGYIGNSVYLEILAYSDDLAKSGHKKGILIIEAIWCKNRK